jgi:hypothetical protein
VTHLHPLAVAHTSSSPVGCTAMPRGASSESSPSIILACKGRGTDRSTHRERTPKPNQIRREKAPAGDAPGAPPRASSARSRSRGPPVQAGRGGRRPRRRGWPSPLGAGSTPRTPPSRRRPPPQPNTRRRLPWGACWVGSSCRSPYDLLKFRVSWEV